jgi:succinate dehydrogenase/fumarate reductase cytochrome b subunit
MSKLVRTQALSGLIFSVFLVVHLFNTALAALGPETYDGFQRAARSGYQFAPLELLTLGALLVHVGCGIARMVQRRGQPKPAMTWETRAHRWSAYYLLTFFIGHVTATRGASFFYGVFPQFEGVAFTFRWVPAYFWPYYSLLFISGAVHLIIGVKRALPAMQLGALPWPRSARTVLISCVLAAVLGLVGILNLGGVLRDVGTPENGPFAKLVLSLVAF